MFAQISALVSYLSEVSPPGFIFTLLAIPIANYKHMKTYFAEFVGTILMIGFTFSPGKWIFSESLYLAWVVHAVGVVAADKIGGGQHVNPAVSVAMFSLGKCDYSEMYVRIAGAMGGGLVAFPLFKAMTDILEWTPLGGPEFNSEGDEDGSIGAWSEFTSSLLLCILIYLVNWELNFGKNHYWIKQTLTAFGIRALIEIFPTAGPAMNPMLGTTWAVFAYGSYPDDVRHYLVYWVAAILGALASGFAYAVYDGRPFFGQKLPFGPINPPKEVPATKKKKKN